jgi:uncharacterized protein YbjT (DUF2867 family)
VRLSSTPSISGGAAAGDAAVILVTGASGTVGREVLAPLTAAGEAVRAVVRDPGRARAPAGVDVVAGDLDRPASLAGPLAGARGVFLLGGFADMPGLLAEIRRAGVQRVTLLGSGCVVGGRPQNAITRMWLESEAAVRESGVAWTVLRSSGFAANALRWREQLRAGDVVRAPWPDVAIAAIDPADIAAAAVAVLTRPGHEGTAPMLTGPAALRPAEQVAILGRVLERDLRYEPQSDDEARAAMAGRFPDEVVDAFFAFYSAGEYDDSIVRPDLPRIIGRPARSFADWAAANASRLT